MVTSNAPRHLITLQKVFKDVLVPAAQFVLGDSIQLFLDCRQKHLARLRCQSNTLVPQPSLAEKMYYVEELMSTSSDPAISKQDLFVKCVLGLFLSAVVTEALKPVSLTMLRECFIKS